MAYKPFKMKGHSLPGPNQRKSPAKQATLSSVRDSLQNLPNPAAEKLRKEYEAAQKKLQEDAQKNMDSNIDSTNTARQKVYEKRAKDIQQNVSPKEFKKQVKEVSSPAKQGWLEDQSMPRFKGVKETKMEKDRREKKSRKPGESKYQADVRTHREKGMKRKKFVKDISKLMEKRRVKSFDEESKDPNYTWQADPKKKKSPAKCPLIAALPAITGAIGAVGAMKKKKEEQ